MHPSSGSTDTRLAHATEALARAARAQRAGGPVEPHVSDAVRLMREAAATSAVRSEDLLAVMRRAWSSADGDGSGDDAVAEVVRLCMREYFRVERRL